MFTAKWILNNRELFLQGMQKRNYPVDIEQITDLYGSWKNTLAEIEDIKCKKNKIVEKIARLSRSSEVHDLDVVTDSAQMNSYIEKLKCLSTSIIEQIKRTANRNVQSNKNLEQVERSEFIIQIMAQLEDNIAVEEILKNMSPKQLSRFALDLERICSISDLAQESEELNEKLIELVEPEREFSNKLHNLLCVIPNILEDDVVVGKDETENIEIRKYGEPRLIDNAMEHFEIGTGLGLLDFENTTNLCGSRFSTMIGDLAVLERAVSNFMLDIVRESSYVELSPPYMTKEHVMFGTGQLPKFEEDLFKTTDGFYLIPTAEVMLTNWIREKTIEESKLPIRLTACTPCFRKEAGAAGRDSRGIIRQHQFKKVELVSITTQKESREEHERMVDIAESVLKKLELPFRTIMLCAGDTGFSSQKTYDIEVWLPGQKKYREISSCSNCGSFQAHRMNAKYKSEDTGKSEFLHTLNGSCLAVGRTIVAIMENYQNSDGSINIPVALQSYMGNMVRINKL